MTVHTLEEYALTIYINDRTLDFEVTETILSRECQFILTTFTLDNAYSIEVRSFSSPSLQALQVELHVCLFDFLISREVDSLSSFCHQFALRVSYLHYDVLLTSQLIAVVEFECNIHVTFLVTQCRIEVRSNIMVAYAYLRHVVDSYIAEDTRHTEHILTFEVRTIAPTHHLYSQTVLTRTEMLGDLEFVVVISSLSVTYVFTIQINECSTIDTTEVDECTSLFPTFRQVEETYV